MGFQYSTGFKKAVCDNGSVKEQCDGGFLKVYSAPSVIPANPDAALPSDAVLLCTFSDNGGAGGLTLAAEAVGGTISKLATQVWKSGATGTVATGTPAFFRYVRPGDTGALDATAVRIQGDVGTSGAAMNLANSTITMGQEYTLDFFSITFMDE